MASYTVTRSNVAISTTADLLSLVAAAGRRVLIRAITIVGMGTTSVAQELMLQRSTGGATPSGGITPEKGDPDTPASGVNAYTAWVTQPTLSGTPSERMAFNSNGGVFMKRWPPGLEPRIAGGAQMSIRSAVGTGNCTITVEYDD
jgi:hypothetical protein